ncbi:hydroxymethylpyrimidine/phosphomethylpyrimidine kinase [Arcicella aurantiaca]|uniref:hydroxymethylpyrimidine kinase n=1 Tax=Arcicella aurantiaca TaxID=591202 RepID=A0A316E541_9BACT|nr:hydroxymethylpyrimidine/phosphomethylpyrimidine kinase [Arcicella aurantiaca]PWK23823.1 hydroxymethylpyrimidine/phosphomethylpyrimidine kinase [Arcicella aurantiaca]
MNKRPFALTIAGFDPSGGAGLLADIKTFEANQIYGLGVCTALTVQHENRFDSVQWIESELIIEQARLLFEKYDIQYVKIGLIKSLEDLSKIINALLSWNPDLKIIWDPILKASAGFNFHDEINANLLKTILKQIYVLTPNLPEANLLVNDSINTEEKAQILAENCAVFLKGGHGDLDESKDVLFYKNQRFEYLAKRIEHGEKHGSGCVLSSAITANLAKGLPLEKACEEAKKYITAFLGSNNSLLGYHL